MIHIHMHVCMHTPEEVGSKDNGEVGWVHLVLSMVPADNVEVADEVLQEGIVGGWDLQHDLMEKLQVAGGWWVVR